MLHKRHILILTSDSGFGHRSAANSIASALELNYCGEVTTSVINPIFEQPVSALLKKVELYYDRTVRDFPNWFRLAYKITNTRSTSVLVENTLILALYRNIYRLVTELKPDVITSTNLMYGAPTGAVLSLKKLRTPFYTIITDLADVHSMWFNDNSDRFYAASEIVKARAISCGIDPNKISISGIPINPVFSIPHPPKKELRKALGIDPQLATLLVVGSRRVSGILDFLHALDKILHPFQVVVVAGGDNELYDKISTQPWNFPVHVKNFVSNMPEWMLCSDILVTKAGGLIISEGLASGLPILMIDYLPGQEEGNVRFVLENNAGAIANSPKEFSHLINFWLQDDQKILKIFKENSRSMGYPDSASKIADDLWQAANREITPAIATSKYLALTS